MLSCYTVPFSSWTTLHSRLPFYFLSDSPPNPNLKKGKMRKASPFLISPLLCTSSYRDLLRVSALFFPNNMEGFKRTICIGYFCSSAKVSKKKRKDATLVCCQTIHQVALISL